MPADPHRGVPGEFFDHDHDNDNAMRRASATALGLVALVAGGGGGYLVGTRHSDTTTVASAPVKLSTAKVQQLDLVTYDETTATLGFTTSATVSSPVAGTVTSIVAGGDTVDAGTVVATVDGAPVVAMIGDIPTYRDLSTASSNGADIRQLELNLVQLGFDPDHKIVIDEKYDTATKDAVTAWENSLGVTGDGQITKGELVFIPGRLLVDTVSATVGGSVNAGSALVVGRQAVITPPTALANATNGSAVKVTLTLQNDAGVLIAPAEALVSRLDGSYAVQEQTSDGTTKWLTVDLLGVSGANVAIRGDGLSEGTVLLLPV